MRAKASARLGNGETDNPFHPAVLPLVRRRHGTARISDGRHASLRLSSKSRTIIGKRVRFRCEDPDCDFSTELGLPVEVVDEGIYETPPTLLIGTVDKFAMLPLEPGARSIFGIDRPWSPPDLIIQDELHLISGPLGSMVGHYETVIDELCNAILRPDDGCRPGCCVNRYHRTRRRSRFGRSTVDALRFSPAGPAAGESFFAKEGDSAEGRAYVGVHAVALSSHVTAQVRTLAALLQAPAFARTRMISHRPLLDAHGLFQQSAGTGTRGNAGPGRYTEYLNAVWERIGLTEDHGRGGGQVPPPLRQQVQGTDEPHAEQ